MESPDIVFVLTREDVIAAAGEMGLPAEAITDEVLESVKTGIGFGLEYWPDVVKACIAFALKP